MTLATALAELRASLDQGNEALTTKHFRLLAEALESIQQGDVAGGGFIHLGSGTELTIASGVVTAVQSFHAIDTEGDIASDDLDTINGGAEGDLLMLRASASSRTVVLRDFTVSGGNIFLDGSTAFSLDHARDRILLACNDVGNWCELSRSSNT